MTTRRMIPSSAILGRTTAANGRNYVAAAGAVVDAPIQDALVLGANGWVSVADSGPTSARPVRDGNGALLGPGYGVGRLYADTTIGLLICWTGANWADPVPGVRQTLSQPSILSFEGLTFGKPRCPRFTNAKPTMRRSTPPIAAAPDTYPV